MEGSVFTRTRSRVNFLEDQISDTACVPTSTVVSEMDVVHSRLHSYTHDLRPFLPGADANENAMLWQSSEVSIVGGVPVLVNADGDRLAIPIPRDNDYIMQNRILFRLLCKVYAGRTARHRRRCCERLGRRRQAALDFRVAGRWSERYLVRTPASITEV